jgi:PAS domain S-box-containing protein
MATVAPALIDVLLRYAREAVGADHACFCEWRRADDAVAVVAADGILTAPSVLPGEPMPLADYEFAREPLSGDTPIVYARGGDPRIDTFLRSVGAGSQLAVPVGARGYGRWFLELYFADRDRTVCDDDVRAAERLVPMVAAALDRDILAEQLSRRDRELEEAEARYRTLVEHYPGAIWLDAADGAPAYVSPQIESLYGIGPAEWLSDTDAWITRVHPDDQARVRAVYTAHLATGGAGEDVYRIVTPAGEVRWVHERFSRVENADGAAMFTFGVIRDVTDEHETAVSLAHSERRFRALIENQLDIVCVVNVEGTFAFASPSTARVLGHDPAAVLGTPPSDLTHPEDAAALARALAPGAAHDDLRLRWRHADGGWRIMAGSSVDLRADPAVSGVVLTLRDVTGLTTAALELRESERRFADLLETVRLAAVVLDREGRIVSCNPYLAELSGYTEEELVGRRWLDTLVPDVSLEAERAFYAELARGGVIAHQESQLLRRDGTTRLFSWNNALLRDVDGAVVGAVGIGEDITDQREAERALAVSEERRQQVLGEMLRAEEHERARIAMELHDDTIQVMTATLLSLDRLANAVRDGNSAAAADAAARARQTLADAVERTRRLTFELRPQLLQAAGLEPALRDLAAQIGSEAGFEAVVSAPATRLPDAVESLVYRTMRELIANVRKHAQATRVDVTVEVEDGWLSGSVADDGRGFDVVAARHPTHTRLHLGLDSLEERIRLAGGEVSVESGRGTGTRVTFRLPME